MTDGPIFFADPNSVSDFLALRLEEDRQQAGAAVANLVRRGSTFTQWTDSIWAQSLLADDNEAILSHVDLHNPYRTLDEIMAKYALLELHAVEWAGTPDQIAHRQLLGCVICDDTDITTGERVSSGWPCPTLRLIASAYRSHPDYKQRWAVDTPWSAGA